ncbi:hypothetical protein TRFO_25456 [Tritrichomonas foetus]|uniref:Thioredoxin domain-containing protein n=1 Tax=Tritrichomonas foetus TaxID=1144522 RepID=A0A1J4KA28_9EUKA|nr:hypothetical protein TRFO_25456 [Tritrichomonas foetus]|eukprot:OHT06502.1 hypothetical protein TRFO_25456 [Tritrichomonas foetus]
MDGHRFRNAVFHREPLDVWVSLISSQDLSGHTEANAAFDDAFKLSKGFLKFAYLDSSKNVHIPRRLEIKSLPSYCVFHTSGQICIPANISARELINFASYYLPDLSEKANPEWIKKDESNPVAILFTEKEATPMLWAAIATAFYKSTIRIGVSRDHDFAKTLGVEQFPSIVFHNYTHNIIYEGQNDYLTLKLNIKKFWQKRFSRTRSALTVKPMSEYKKLCKGSDKICLIHTVENVDSKFERLRKKHTTQMIEFLFGHDELPIPEMKKNGIYAIYPEKQMYIDIGNFDNLNRIITDIISEKAEWKNYQIENNNELDENEDREL